jgi:acyl carrier protein
MKKTQFLQSLKDELEFEIELNLSTNLNELDEWDSMSAMVLIGYVSEKFGTTLTGDHLKKINSIEALIEYIGEDKFE